ncbi:hypothetical protein [Aureimonas sp. Leaf324]|jgi:hypothetical protein|uniref:hypothetical protein n=1 Tax=Aureimonas sp. Leaf324 TaxID=1736336 RepID=UPI0006FDCC5E|nr:hypothetical protein [Aureimonas sp. Leaf324]KQQ85851.1 hypothetical protein ASF65_04760 [Aureimonas sp. Leaf324]
MTRHRDPHTKDLLAWEAQTVRVGFDEEVTGRGDLSSRIARFLARALADAKDAGMDRNDIARAMGEYLDRPIAKATIDKWASEAADDRRIDLDCFIALVHVTRDLRLLGFMPAMFGCAVVADRYVDLIELHEIEEHEREVAARKSALQAKVRGRR